MNQKKPVLTLANILLHHDTTVRGISAQLANEQAAARQDPLMIAYLRGKLDALQEWDGSIKTEFRYDPAIWQ